MSHLFFHDQSSEILERPVICSFDIIGKATGRKLPAFYMIGDTFATDSFAGTWFICTVAFGKVLFFFTLHGYLLLKIWMKRMIQIPCDYSYFRGTSPVKTKLKRENSALFSR